MQQILRCVSSAELKNGFLDKHQYQLYKEWDRPVRQLHIAAITLLTAALYGVFAFLPKSWIDPATADLMWSLHLCVIVPNLLFISFLAYQKKFYNLVMGLLGLSPVIAMMCHAYVASQMENYLPYLSEGYLCIFWTFIVSGMTFRVALISAIISAVILLISGFHFIANRDAFVIHGFWILSSFSFGFVGAFLYDRSRKSVFKSQQALEKLAITDSLTGLFNRSQLSETLTQEMERSKRYKQTFGFMVIDIDYFKSINDEYGHAQGDQALRQVAEVLSNSIRDTDTIIRWGGEEFVVIALEVDESSLTLLSDKLRQQVESTNFYGLGQVTVSVGATLFKYEDTQSSLFSRTDQALYQAKQQGRNTTVYV
jgi:diguanylate cyclase (GGDEF)-like protein